MAKRIVYTELPDYLVLNTHVRYYDNGWRVGLLDKWEKGMGIIIPSCKTKHIKVEECNIEPIEKVTGS